MSHDLGQPLAVQLRLVKTSSESKHHVLQSLHVGPLFKIKKTRITKGEMTRVEFEKLHFPVGRHICIKKKKRK